MKYIFLTAMVLLCFSVQNAFADVVVNEIAWMGTSTSTADEWIELYNNGSAPVDVTGWSLVSADGTPSINLAGSIGAQAYAVLERTDDTTVPAVNAFVIYTGALSNTGETLFLKNTSNETIDSVSNTDGWAGGSSSTFETMQRSGNIWLTGNGTPGEVNISSGTTGDSGEDSGTTYGEDTEGAETDSEEIVQTSPKKKEDLVYAARMIPPDGTIIAGSPAEFKSSIKRSDDTTLMTGYFVWSFGDGTEKVSYSALPVYHTYQNPGTFVVVFRYFVSQAEKVPTTIHKKEITVIEASVVFKKTTRGYEINNTSKKDIDIGGWKISDPLHSFTFPLYTIMKSGGGITIPFERAGFDSGQAQLFTSEGIVMASQELIKPVTVSETRTVLTHRRKPAPLFVNNLETLATVSAAEAATTTSLHKTTSQKPRNHILVYFGLFLLGAIGIVIWYTRTYTKPKKEESLPGSGNELEDILYYDDRS